MSRKRSIEHLMEQWGGTFSSGLGIDIVSGRSGEIFKWFLASLLFGTRIRQNVAEETYRQFENNGVLTPDGILATGWDGLVEILDSGGYVRYNFKTATKLLEIAGLLNTKYSGDLNNLHKEAKDAADLVAKLGEFKGVGPVTVNIFLRELRGIWEKADPLPGDMVIESAMDLGFITSAEKDPKERKKALSDLKTVWERTGLSGNFSEFEASLVRYGIEQRRQKRRKE
jgi:endonuclease III